MGCVKNCTFCKFLNCRVELETLFLIRNNTDHVSQTYNQKQHASDCCIYFSEIWCAISCVIVDIEVERAGEGIRFSLSPGMCVKDCKEVRTQVCFVPLWKIAHRQTNQQKTCVSQIFSVGSGFLNVVIFRLLVIVIILCETFIQGAYK
jgi:hypothetical protein